MDWNAEQATEANGGEEPHFKPARSTHHWERRFVLPTPPGYTVNHPRREAVDLVKKPCKIPIEWDSKSGKATNWLGGGPDRQRPGGRCHVCGIRAMRQGLDVGENARWSQFACKHCRVILCDGCWDLWDHEKEQAPPDLPPAAAGKSRPEKTPSKPLGPELPAAPRCPAGHIMNGNTMDGSGLTCDGCMGSLGTTFFSCCKGVCDFDLCLACSEIVPATALPPTTTKRAQRAGERAAQPAEDEPPVPEPTVPAPRPKAQRLPSKEAKKRAASARAKCEQKKQAMEAKLKAARAKKHAENRKPAAVRKRKRHKGDDCSQPRKRRGSM